MKKKEVHISEDHLLKANNALKEFGHISLVLLMRRLHVNHQMAFYVYREVMYQHLLDTI